MFRAGDNPYLPKFNNLGSKSLQKKKKNCKKKLWKKSRFAKGVGSDYKDQEKNRNDFETGPKHRNEPGAKKT